MTDPIFIAHTGTGTFFSLSDSGFIISDHDLREHMNDDLIDDDAIADAAMERGYQITDELAAMIYELVMNYHEGKLQSA